MKPFLVVGAGFSGAVLARELATHTGRQIIVIDQRQHIAGNCHTDTDPDTGIMVHEYGPHIFNTNSEYVWNYVSKYGELIPYTNRVKAKSQNSIFSLPINLHTINQFFQKTFSPIEAKEFISSLGNHQIQNPQNFEEQALKFLGEDLYRAFFYGYTKKQWGCEPNQLPASILKRLPVRFNYNDSYYDTKFQGIPRNGYTEIIAKILSHAQIEVRLDTTFEKSMRCDFEHVFYTGCLDEFFDFQLGHLGYRTVFWNKGKDVGDFQGNAVINYTDLDVPFTRIHEHKHFAPWEKHHKTLYFTEFSKETGLGDIPYYPKRLTGDMEKIIAYRNLATQEKQVSFLGRLATYRYMNMDQVIDESLLFAEKFLKATFTGEVSPIFSNDIP
jgi:UDP-galactopyranose mutase